MPFSVTALAAIVPTDVDRYVGLLTAAPDIVAGTFAEPTDSGYARVNCAKWTDIDAGGGVAARENLTAVVFPAVADAAMTVSHWAIFDASVAGNLLVAGPILNIGLEAEPQTVLVGDTPRFNASALKLLSEET